MKKREQELMVLPGCVGCLRNCNWRGSTTMPEVAKNLSDRKYTCNTSREVK